MSEESYIAIKELICQCLQVEMEQDPFWILGSVEKMFEAILSVKVCARLLMAKLNLETQVKKFEEEGISSYESSLQKLEAEIRQHIRIEQQLKLYAENTQQKYDDLAKAKEEAESSLKVRDACAIGRGSCCRSRA